MAGKLYIRTFGCQMNEYDSRKMEDVLRESHGLELTDDPGQADVLLLNTCSIRERRRRRSFRSSVCGRTGSRSAPIW